MPETWTVVILGPGLVLWRCGFEYLSTLPASAYDLGTVARLTDATTCSTWTACKVDDDMRWIMATGSLAPPVVTPAFVASDYAAGSTCEIS